MSNSSAALGAFAQCSSPALCVASTGTGSGSDVTLPFLLTLAAGLSTIIGAASVFTPCVTSHASMFLAGSLALASGVMMYVSLVEVLPEASHYLCCVVDSNWHAVAVAVFFSGVALTHAAHAVTHACSLPRCCRRTHEPEPAAGLQLELTPVVTAVTVDAPSRRGTGGVGLDDTPIEGEHASMLSSSTSTAAVPTVASGGGAPSLVPDEAQRQRLLRMGMMTAGAIFVHNLPEGLVSFVGGLADVKLGLSLALAIALHNIPEGIVASVPLYYATGNKWRAFMWGAFSGLAEPVGALLGWAILQPILGPAVYGTVFALIAGIMVYIVVRETLPTAYRYDPDDKVCTNAFFGGMLIMAMSLLLFEI